MGHATAFRRPEGVEVKVRRMRFEFEERGFARHWHGGSAFKSLFWSQLSTSFEPGERFFIDSARALRDHVDDPGLLTELREFCKQEGQHTRQHLKFDAHNAALGLDVEGCRRRYAWALNRARRKLDPLGMLAATVALEHFTAAFAQMFFDRPELSAGADPAVTALWAWHAAEEAEHKATCYDVYRAAGGGYLRRIFIMPGAWFLILAIAMLNTFILVRREGTLWSRDTLRGLRYLFGRRGMITGLVPHFFAFFRPRFHPWQHNNADQIATWQAHNRKYITAGPGAPASAH